MRRSSRLPLANRDGSPELGSAHGVGSRRIKIPPRGDKPEFPDAHDDGGFAVPAPEMHDHVYKILELVGSSEKSIEDAIQNAITRASKTIRDMKWFEVVQTRGHIENGSLRHYQVTLRVGFTLEG
jgi:flavin-binding protein dodecin